MAISTQWDYTITDRTIDRHEQRYTNYIQQRMRNSYFWNWISGPKNRIFQVVCNFDQVRNYNFFSGDLLNISFCECELFRRLDINIEWLVKENLWTCQVVTHEWFVGEGQHYTIDTYVRILAIQFKFRHFQIWCTNSTHVLEELNRSRASGQLTNGLVAENTLNRVGGNAAAAVCLDAPHLRRRLTYRLQRRIGRASCRERVYVLV